MNDEPIPIARFVDRTGWPPGPWDREPRDLYRFHAHGFPAIMGRAAMGHWCGYVAVPAGHPWYLTERGSETFRNVRVHGEITYADECAGVICHVPRPGEPDSVWWVGFDCGHIWDLSPRMLALDSLLLSDLSDMPEAVRETFRKAWRPIGEIHQYKTAGYVRAEVFELAKQAREAGQRGD